MKPQRRTAKALLGLCLMVTAPATAQEADKKNQITVFGGVTLVDANGKAEWKFGAGNFPGNFPSIPGFPGGSVRGEGSLDSGAALFGARFSRELEDRLALEADLTLAP